MKQYTREEILDAMNTFYMETGKDRPLEYTYGFFDSMGRLIELLYGKETRK